MKSMLALVAGAVIASVFAIIMSNKVPETEYTTNALDREQAAKLQARLAESKHSAPPSSDFQPVECVQIAEGRHKYVLISAREPSSQEFTYFVTSRKGAHYHRNAAEPLVDSLEKSGYQDIEITGGGRIFLNTEERKISVFGFSYGFGQANHEISKRVIQADGKYKNFDVTVSNDGY